LINNCQVDALISFSYLRVGTTGAVPRMWQRACHGESNID